MKEFTLESFVAHLASMSVAVVAEEHHALERAAKMVEAEAKREIGQYQDAAHPFAPWSELAESTKTDRIAQGYSENDPGLRSGAMRDSIQHAVLEHEAHVGSDDDKMVWFELGTSKQPPRSVLGTALVHKTEEVVEVLGDSLITALVGEGVHKGRLEFSPDEK